MQSYLLHYQAKFPALSRSIGVFLNSRLWAISAIHPIYSGITHSMPVSGQKTTNPAFHRSSGNRYIPNLFGLLNYFECYQQAILQSKEGGPKAAFWNLRCEKNSKKAAATR
jgi:hypothetical protein